MIKEPLSILHAVLAYRQNELENRMPQESPPKRINIQDKKDELTKRLWYDIANQDSFYVYIDKQGNVYNEEGFYLETIKMDS